MAQRRKYERFGVSRGGFRENTILTLMVGLLVLEYYTVLPTFTIVTDHIMPNRFLKNSCFLQICRGIFILQCNSMVLKLC